jgi:hypothetical protein
MLAFFRGGPLAGQTLAIERYEPTYRVPTFPPMRFTSDEVAKIQLPELECEEYRVGGGSTRDYDIVYDWVNPAKVLRERILDQQRTADALRAKIASLEEQLETATVAMNKWNKLVEAAGHLLDEA